MIEKQRDNDKKMTGKWQKNMTKKHKFLASFIFLDSKYLRFFCHVFVMFDWCPWCFHDSSCVMYHLDFHASLRMSPKYGGWNRVPKEWMIEIPVKMGCNEIIITCTWNASIIKKKQKNMRIFFFSGIYRAF